MAATGGPNSMTNAPLLRVLLFSVSFLSFFCNSHWFATNFALSLHSITSQGQLWRLFTCHFAFLSTPEAMFGLYLLYLFRCLERMAGSSRFLAFSLFSVLAASIIQLFLLFVFTQAAAVLIQTLPSPSSPASSLFSLHSLLSPLLSLSPSSLLCPGPYALIFSSLLLFHFDVPPTSRFSLAAASLPFPFALNDKTLVYVAAMQLCFSSSLRSILPSIAGLLAGALYRSNLFRLRALKVPDSWIHLLTLTRSLPHPSSSVPSLRPPAAHVRTVTAAGDTSASPTFLSSSHAPPRPGVPPSSAQPSFPSHGSPVSGSASAWSADSNTAVTTLVAMGFSQQEALRALQQSNNDVHDAANILLASLPP